MWSLVHVQGNFAEQQLVTTKMHVSCNSQSAFQNVNSFTSVASMPYRNFLARVACREFVTLETRDVMQNDCAQVMESAARTIQWEKM